MSPLTGLARLPGRILWSVHMENCSPVDWDEIQETKPKWWNLGPLHMSSVSRAGLVSVISPRHSFLRKNSMC